MGKYQSASWRNGRLLRRTTQECSAAFVGEYRKVYADNEAYLEDFDVKDGYQGSVSKGPMLAPACTAWFWEGMLV